MCVLCDALFLQAKAAGHMLHHDEYEYRMPDPKQRISTPKYTKAKVQCTQDKHTQLRRALLLPKKALLMLACLCMLTHTHYGLATCALKNWTTMHC